MRLAYVLQAKEIHLTFQDAPSDDIDQVRLSVAVDELRNFYPCLSELHDNDLVTVVFEPEPQEEEAE